MEVWLQHKMNVYVKTLFKGFVLFGFCKNVVSLLFYSKSSKELAVSLWLFVLLQFLHPLKLGASFL